MKKLVLGLMVFGFVIIMVTCSLTEDKKSQDNDAEKPNIAILIKQLGNDDFHQRESAHKELIEYGDNLIKQYQKVKFAAETQRLQKELDVLKDEITKFAHLLGEGWQSKDPEIKIRSQQIRQYLYSLTQPKIAFSSNQDGDFEIYVMDADGKNQTKLTENKASDMGHTWSPDGKKIAFISDRDSSLQIYIMDTDGKNQTRLTSSHVMIEHPAWSPDGKKISFQSLSREGGNCMIDVIDVDDKKQTRLTENTTYNRKPAWSPDGKKIAFISRLSGRDITHNISVMDADGKNNIRLTNNQNCWNANNPAWSPDGARIAFDLGGALKQIYVMDVDGKNQTRLTAENSSNADNANPAWSPDGTKIVFQSTRDGNHEIYVMDADGKNQTRLTENKASDMKPIWNPLTDEISVLFR
jgi:Tol biopolymer transport system component